VVRAGIDVLQRAKCRVIGLETMPRTMDNIGFYAGLGFVPTRLTVTLTVDAAPAPRAPRLLSALPSSARGDAIDECRALVDAMRPGYDYSRELELTHDLALGDTLLLYRGDVLDGFALCHAAPLVEGRSREELRVLKMVLRDSSLVDAMVTQLADFAGRSATARAAIRLQGEYSDVFRALIARGARVRWTDLRMVLDGYAELTSGPGVVLSNWEI
jgi:hypothetical protein